MTDPGTPLAVPDPALLARFAAELDRLHPPGERLGVAVSGGPDSIALLILAEAARPGNILAATVDHRLRPESADEAASVASLCERMGIPHDLLVPAWEHVPSTGIQAQARTARYAALGAWMDRRGLLAIATGHHADDQAETLLMRLGRGSGVRGLAAMRASSPLPGARRHRLLRPLLDWRKATLQAVCASAGVNVVDDPSNRDPAYERSRIRDAIDRSGWIDASKVAQSAAALADADEALDWAMRKAWPSVVISVDGGTDLRVADLPAELRRRIVTHLILSLAGEGSTERLAGAEVDRLLAALQSGQAATLRGVRAATADDVWQFRLAKPRRQSGS